MPSQAKVKLDTGQHIHLIGIGGVGMSGLAGMLAEKGFAVSGSDTREGPRLAPLRQLGIEVAIGQTRDGAAGADLIFRSTAIKDDNPEVEGARERGIPILHRSDLLVALVEDDRKVAVGGTHGKTTTTAMLGTILLGCGRDPTIIIGGEAHNLGANYHCGTEPLAVFEACESDLSFLKYGPCSEVISTVEADHLDIYKDFESLCDAFRRFAALVPSDGFLVYGASSQVLAEMAEDAAGAKIPFGLNSEAVIGADSVVTEEFGVKFEVVVNGELGPRIALQVPGEHNVLNALAAISAARELGVSVEDAARALGEFRGVRRRFELIGRLGGALIVDDYAHHPTEVAATLTAARKGWDRRIVATFQPHLYSRTRDFMEGFADALAQADVIVINDIYAAREEPMEGVSASQLADAIRARAPDKQVEYLPDKAAIVELLRRIAQPDDLILTLGAGDIREVAEQLAAQG